MGHIGKSEEQGRHRERRIGRGHPAGHGERWSWEMGRERGTARFFLVGKVFGDDPQL